MSYKVILCEGDSWTSGDIINPALEEQGITWINDPLNDEYRLPKVWPHKLGTYLNDVKVINNSEAGSSNDGIVRRVIPKVLELLKENSPEDIFVIIGWSSPERKDFYCDYHKDYLSPRWETLYPAELYQDQQIEDIKKFYEIYLKYYWNIEEFASRYLQQVLLISNFLKNKGINYKFFNGFYESSGTDFDGDLYRKYYLNKRRGLPTAMTPEFKDEMEDLYGDIDDLLYEEYLGIYGEDYVKKTFKKYCDEKEKVWSKKWNNNHPNERMHTLWAEFIYKEIFEDG